VVTFSTDKANPGAIIDAKEFSTATGIARDGTRTLLGGSINPVFGDNISNAEATRRLGSDAIASYQNKAIPGQGELFNREVRKDKKGQAKAAVSLALLAVPVAEGYHLYKAIGEVAYEAYNLYREVKDARGPEQ